MPGAFRAEDLRAPFKRFGPLRDIYLPRDYHTGEPRGFGFVQYLDPLDAEEAQYHMNHQIFYGRELTVIFAEETRKKPSEMRNKERLRSRGFSEDNGRSYYSHRGRSRTRSRSRTPSRWHRYSRSPHDYSPPEFPLGSPSPDRHELRNRGPKGGWSGSASRKYRDRSPSGSPVSPSGRCIQKSSKHETHSGSCMEAKHSASGRHSTPHNDGSPAERYSESPPHSPSLHKQGRSSCRSKSPPQEDDSPCHSGKEHSSKGPSPEHSSMD
ncbi:hypothetical protein GOP47_0005878 [Adiantum capillus-veneris]|uniref:RRM domain-containing protein n=1 Tax=Adiantum capillus-veneris TaxID=13818 RepID=A0A9D4V3C6_ADICA|nr:hypothetical protein GOP47_0005878 [Adiantum capillus-veneris]